MLMRLLQSVLAPLCAALLLAAPSAAQLSAPTPLQPRYGINLVAAGYSTSAIYAIGDLVSNTASGVTSYYLSLACQGAPKCPTYTAVQPLTVAAAWVNLGSGTGVLAPYSSGQTYAVGQIVLYNNLGYSAIQATTGNLPTNTAYWTQLWDAAGAAAAAQSIANAAAAAAAASCQSSGTNCPAATTFYSTTGTGGITFSPYAPGVEQAVLASTTVTPGCYTLGSLATCVNAAGQVTSIGSPFSFTMSCTAAGTYEAGATTTNPNTCTFSYSNGTAASAMLADSFSHTGSISSPWSSGTLAYSYCTVGEGISSQTFTGNATATNGQTAPAVTLTANCTYRTFAGAAGAGATSATASGTTAVLNGGLGTLASASSLGNQSSYTCTTTATQYCYVLMAGGSHTFTSGGFSFPMNSPTYVGLVNVNGVTTPLYLYQSVNSFVSGVTFTLVVASFLVWPMRRRKRLPLALFGIAFLALVGANSALAQGVQLGAPPYIPSAGTSQLGQVSVVMTDANCTVLGPSGCTVNQGSASAWLGSYVVTSGVSLTASRNLVFPLFHGAINIENATTGGQSIIAGGVTGATVTIPNCSVSPNSCWVIIVSDGTNFTTLSAYPSANASISASQVAGLGTAATRNTTGSGTAVPTGPTSSTNGDLVSFMGTSGQIADSGCGIPVSVACGGLGGGLGSSTGYLYDTAGTISTVPGVNPACAGSSCTPNGTQTNVQFGQKTPCVLSTSISSSATPPFTFTCSPYAGFPNSTGGALLFFQPGATDEIMYYSSYSAGVFTVTSRAVYPSISQSFTPGASVYGFIDLSIPCAGCLPTYGLMNNLQATYNGAYNNYTSQSFFGATTDAYALGAASLEVTSGPTSLTGQLYMAGTVMSVDGVTTAGNFGVSPIVYSPVRLTGQTASTGTLNALCNASICPAGRYRLVLYSNITTPGTAGTLGLNCGWTDDSGAETKTSSTLALTATPPASYLSQTCDLYTAGSANITYSATVAGATGSPVFTLTSDLQRVQ